ncbi:hypothetical protein K402DRAFT_420549 [Aulographum hederae CBS 113979]|uniref:Uncharacterized protein n=1 Tax=Aulographum hederae CBS 113979 TaxID=1176131 RepID=A0A6G1H2T6_9PEZI|nr:hypothetical protein K402DRAFT_420549 [Aulographum hederae CBS 113979]
MSIDFNLDVYWHPDDLVVPEIIDVVATVYFEGGKEEVVEFFADIDDSDDLCPDLWYMPGKYRIMENPKTSEGLEFIKNLLEDCDQDHKECKKVPPESPLPNRVIDIGLDPEADIVKLYETKNEVAKYMCLCHHWGPMNPSIFAKTSALKKQK